MTWAIRRASPRDQPALEALCRAAVGEGDYILRYLPKMLLTYVINVAVDKRGRIVGMMSYRPCLDGSGWLGQARTHRDFRRQGVAKALTESFVGIAANASVPVLRLWTDSWNADALAALAAMGFREVARFTRMVGPAARGKAKAAPLALAEDVWHHVKDSPYVRKGSGFVQHDWCFMPVTRPLVFVLAAKGAFLGWEGRVISLSRPQDEETFEFAAWSGPPAELFAEACRQADASGRPRVATFVPADRDLLAEARRAGLQPDTWANDAVLAELSVRPAQVRRVTRPSFAELAARRARTKH